MTSHDSETLIRVAVAVVEQGGRYLIGQRPADVVLAGFWEFPGGKLRPGESPEEAAVRECREETGLDVLATGRHSTVVERYPHGAVEVTFIMCRPVSSAEELQAPFRWVAAADLPEYRFPSANAALIRQLAAAALSQSGTNPKR